MTTRAPASKGLPPPAAAIALFVALVLTGRLMPIEWALVLTPILVLTLTAAAAVVFRVDLRETFHLRLPSVPDLAMAFPLAISFFVIGDQIAGLTQSVAPMEEGVLDAMRGLLRVETASDWWTKLLIIGVAASVSEELMFRGFVLSALARPGRTGLAVLFSSLLFMALHPQFLATLAAGLVLGYLTIATRSILVPMTVHLVNNVSTLLLFNLAGLETLGEPVWIPPSILAPAVAIFALTALYYVRALDAEDEDEDADVDEPTVRASESRPRSAIAPEVLARLQSELSTELDAIPAGRRRLGWLIVGLSVLVGCVVLFGLFSTSVYYLYPERVHEAGIQVLHQQSQEELDVRAADKGPSLTSAFEALSALNASGQLDIMDLARVQEAFVRLRSDGTLDSGDADALVETIRQVVQDKAGAKPL